MLIAHYAHRLPANFDTVAIRARAQTRGTLWDDAKRLYFKGFLLREAGRYGATANDYSSLYLWRDGAGFRDFLVGGHYRNVTDSFGRAEIDTRVVLDARRGLATTARFAYKEERDIPVDADLTATLAAEIERNREIARQEDTVVAAVGVDAARWRITRILLSTGEAGEVGEEGETSAPGADSRAAGNITAYQVLYLAAPELDELPAVDA
ncbi:DUF4865 family protein [Cupriavidus pampae]|uniref:DUF4865 family protein n=1 Tax=Cupriavidus pampae TaxID=659251 RepID=A0ABN7ZIH1_9BURK|nr:DUF4865 family protein [Cupriavidus pampae]CAG9185773.1 hypothetical protein LMG32289_06100 [Cupriavidus pampae]